MVPEQLSSDIETTTDDKQQLQSIEDQALTELMDESSSDRGDDTEQMSLLTAEEEVELAMCIEAGVLACERLAADTSELSGEDIADLGELIRLGEDAYTRMLASNQGLVRKYANYYDGLGLSFDDLVQEGNFGLIRAVQKFDYQLGYKFSTYAGKCIRFTMLRALANDSRTIRLPVHVGEKVSTMEAYRRKVVAAEGREPSIVEIAEAVELSESCAREYLLAARPTLSLHWNGPADDDREFEEMLGRTGHPDPTARDALAYVVPAIIRRAINMLAPHQKAVMDLRYTGDDVPSFAAVGEALGVTKDAPRQQEIKAVKALRDTPLRQLFEDIEVE